MAMRWWECKDCGAHETNPGGAMPRSCPKCGGLRVDWDWDEPFVEIDAIIELETDDSEPES